MFSLRNIIMVIALSGVLVLVLGSVDGREFLELHMRPLPSWSS